MVRIFQSRRVAAIAILILMVFSAGGCKKSAAPTSAVAATTKEGKAAVEALKKLHIKTQVGINNRDFTTALSDALYPVTEYLKSPAGQAQNSLNEAIRDASSDYITAAEVWNARMDKTYSADNPKYKYGSLAVDVSIRYKEHFVGPKENDWLDPEKALQVIWSSASGSVAKL